MANASKIRIGGIDYDIKDATAQTTATEALNKATAVEDSAIQGVTVNGTAAEVVDHIAQITTTVEDETLILG